MRFIDYRIPVSDLRDPVTFLHFADIHELAGGVDYDLLKDDISYVKNTDNVYGFYQGDGADARNHRDAKQWDYTAIHPWYIDSEHPERLAEITRYQSKRMCAMFDGIRDKMLCGLKGNHSDGHAKRYGFDPDREFAEFMGWVDDDKPIRYSTTVIILRMTFVDGQHESKPILYELQHHCGGGTNSLDANLNWMERVLCNTWTNCHGYFVGHVHKRGARRRSRIQVTADGELGMKPDYQWLGVTGSYLRTYVPNVSNYGEGKYKPSDLGALRSVVTPATSEIHCY
jgi:hypothetical protein